MGLLSVLEELDKCFEATLTRAVWTAPKKPKFTVWGGLSCLGCRCVPCLRLMMGWTGGGRSLLFGGRPWDL